MLQKVAAIVNKVAADLCFRASKARLLLQRQIFAVAATSAACLLLDDNDLLLEKQHQQLARQSTLCRAQRKYIINNIKSTTLRSPTPRALKELLYIL